MVVSFLFLSFTYQLVKSYIIMSRFVFSVCVVLAPKKTGACFKSVVLSLDPSVGCTVPHSVSYALKNPLVKSYLNDYYVVGLNFNYSLL